MARAKNTSRAEARKRTRDQQRAELDPADDQQVDDQPDAEAPAPRPSLFQMPNVREDIAALPSMFRTRRLLWLPFILVFLGFFLSLILYGVPVDLGQWLLLYIQFFFIPSGLFVYFIAGFVAPRGSYLVGFILGVLSGLLYAIAILATWPVGSTPPDAITSIVASTAQGAVLGTFSGGFAAWYRNFLRNMQQGGNKRRAEKEAKDRAKRRDQRQDARRVFKPKA